MVRIRGCHPLRPAFPDRSAPNQNATTWSYYPARASPHGRFGLFPGRSPLLGESLLFSLPGGTKMFQFPPLAPHANKRRCQASCLAGCPIRIPPGQRPCAPNRGFSQLVASFFASVSQGIRHAPSSSSPSYSPPIRRTGILSAVLLWLILSTLDGGTVLLSQTEPPAAVLPVQVVKDLHEMPLAPSCRAFPITWRISESNR